MAKKSRRSIYWGEVVSIQTFAEQVAADVEQSKYDPDYRAWLEREASASEYFWCLHCEQFHTAKELLDNAFWCTTPGCSGGGPGVDLWALTGIKDCCPNFPYADLVAPELGKVYPLYSSK
jgi:hypothetical protein